MIIASKTMNSVKLAFRFGQRHYSILTAKAPVLRHTCPCKRSPPVQIKCFSGQSIVDEGNAFVNSSSEKLQRQTADGRFGDSNAATRLPTQTVAKPRTVVMFPGQGLQYVGMGKRLLDYPSVCEMFDDASGIFGYDLKKLCLEGPLDELDKTVHCQAATLVTSLAALQKLKAENPQAVENCVATAGFSVGEYAALVFSGAISFETAVRVVKVRGEAMQAASELIPSGMLTVFLTKKSRLNYACVVAKDWCKKMGIEDPQCQIANYLSEEVKVIAGNDEALQFLEMNASEFGLRRLKRLHVSGAFHTPLMLPAEGALGAMLRKVEINEPTVPVYSNVDGTAYASVQGIVAGLVQQISSPVKWQQILNVIYAKTKQHAEYPKTYECGPGKSLRSALGGFSKKAYEKMENVEA